MIAGILCRTEVRPTRPAALCGSGFNPTGLTLIAVLCRTGGRDTLLRKQPIAGATASSPSRTAGSAAPCQGCSPTHKTRALCGSGFNPTGLMLISILCRTEVRPTQPAALCGSGFNPTQLLRFPPAWIFLSCRRATGVCRYRRCRCRTTHAHAPQIARHTHGKW